MKKLLFTLMLFAAMHGNAQVANEKQLPYIEVTGTAEKEVVPDIIYISITLYDKIEGKATYSLDDQEGKLKQLLKKLNIDLSNLSLSGANSDVIMKRQKEKGVSQRKDYMLKVSNATQVNQVFEGLYDNNIKEASIARVDHSQITTLRKEVRINAIKAAKEKAIYLLEAIGEQPGKPLIITEDNNNFQPQFNYSNNVRMYDGAAPNEELDFQKIKIKFSYYVKYGIK